MLDSTYGCCTDMGIRYTTTYYDGKVTYNGHDYQTLISSLGSYLVREEAGRVYVIGTPDSIERVLYDFNLKLNDTLVLSYPGQDTYVSWVSGIDSTEIYGKWYKIWGFSGIDRGQDSSRLLKYNVIEGIGCTNGIYYPASPYALTAFAEQLLCFTNDMGITSGLTNPVPSFGNTYIASFDNKTSCSQIPILPPPNNLGTQQITQTNKKIDVVPNPINENSRIILPYNIQSGTLLISNSIGQIVYSTSFNHKDELPLSDAVHTAGIYFYRVTDNQNGQIYPGKFIY